MTEDTTPRIAWPIALIAWLALAAVSTLSEAAVMTVKGQPETLLASFWWAGAEWLIYAALSPAIFALVRRWPLTRARLARRLGILLVAWVAFHVVSSLIFVALDVTFQIDALPTKPREFWYVLPIYLSKKAASTMIVFTGIVVVAHLTRLLGEVRAREREAARLEAALARARLDALRGQLQPHFLFNALNTVTSLMRDDPERAELVLSRLGDLLRLTLQEGNSGEVTLERELAFLERYTEIQRVRFADRLTVEIDVPEECLRVLVPTLLLQPLVENAIRHGIEPRAARGTVTVGARRDSDRLRLWVRDDGVGIGPDGRNGHATNGHGVGLANTRQRLAQQYGDDQAFTVRPREGGGTAVEITLPWREAEDDG